MPLVLFLAVPLLSVLVLTPAAMRIAHRFDILDVPGRRKIHKNAIPLLGGVAIFCGILIGILLDTKIFNTIWPIIVGAIGIVIVGVLDDIKGLSAQFRLVCQCLIAILLIKKGIHVNFLPPTWWGDVGEILITVIWIAGVTSAYNYLDGMDGLASGSVVINLVCFFIILYSSRQEALLRLVLIIMGACIGFLPYNLKKARIFLGEAGSTLLGFLLATIALAGNWAQDNVVKISIPILILGVPIFDMIFTTILRIKEEKVKSMVEWLQYGGKDHFHHYLVDLGLSPFGAVVFIFLITLSMGISAIMVSNDQAVEAFLTLSQAAIIFGVFATLLVVGKKRHSGWRKGAS
ncbi:MAG: undecaprenyl/decaprenyl-phosphate alpha-N-acetylglucosaminyl 1-phosphate transferase [Candidatus Omnitrophica bacterium]|nr:undecaprenyl/decaprenyl-phosphate alpha-N-acetylglucosaminyl 1-phosphate transferase [Candidatus Omnitrophota bacterium]